MEGGEQEAMKLSGEQSHREDVRRSRIRTTAGRREGERERKPAVRVRE